MATSSNGIITSPQYQVFINFRGEELRNSFLALLVKAMKSAKINVFIDERETRGNDIQNLFKRIEESRLGVAIFSERYTESHWCLDELVKMVEMMDQDKLVVIPIFYGLDATNVKNRSGAFGDNYRNLKRLGTGIKPETTQKWKNALKSVSGKMGLSSGPRSGVGSDDRKFVELIVEHVKKVLMEISNRERENEKLKTSPKFGIEQRIKQLEEKLQFDNEKTRFIGVVGMPGIGKTTLAKMLYEKWKHKFKSRMFFSHVGEKSKKYTLGWLQESLVQELLKDIHPDIGHTKNALEVWKDDLLKRKVLVVLDDVSDRKQIRKLLGKRKWIKNGSKIVITSSDVSLLKELVEDTYVIPRLNSRDSFKSFAYHAFGPDNANGDFLKRSRDSRYFLDYAKGNPLALQALGIELCEKDEAYWKKRIETLTQSSNQMIQYVLRRRYDDLTDMHKDAFLDIACFFKSENASYVSYLLDSGVSDSGEVRGEIKDLTDKFFINISGGRVEMHDISCTFAKEIASQALAKSTRVKFRLCNHQDITIALENKLKMENVRGVFLDMSEVTEEMKFGANIFSNMRNLLYLRIYNSTILQEGKVDFKISTPKGLRLPLDELRYLHWPKFRLEKLPSDLNATKLINLELPHSSIKQLWEGAKDTPKLKWIDLSHSRQLRNLSGLSNAQYLERLNLEGCTRLVTLPREMENMTSLISLNMRGCKSLELLPSVKLRSLKILILSDCSKLHEFEVIPENLEALYLDGTALKGLPPAIGDLERIVTLNMKGCQMLETLPESLGKQKALEELILSDCSKLESVPKGHSKHEIFVDFNARWHKNKRDTEDIFTPAFMLK